MSAWEKAYRKGELLAIQPHPDSTNNFPILTKKSCKRAEKMEHHAAR